MGGMLGLLLLSLKFLTLKVKLKLDAEVAKGEKKKKDIAEEFGIPVNTLPLSCTIVHCFKK